MGFEVQMKEVIHRELPLGLFPTHTEVLSYLFDHLPNHGEGGPGHWAWFADADARDALD